MNLKTELKAIGKGILLGAALTGACLLLSKITSLSMVEAMSFVIGGLSYKAMK